MPAATPTRPSLVPASAPIYAEAAVQPTGERREDALAAAGKLLRTGDPAGKLRQLIDDGLAENGGGLTWEKDFAPWLGEDAGVWASNLEAPKPSWAVIVATKDAGGRGDGARPLPRGRPGRHATRTAPTTASTTRSTPSGSRTA